MDRSTKIRLLLDGPLSRAILVELIEANPRQLSDIAGIVPTKEIYSTRRSAIHKKRRESLNPGNSVLTEHEKEVFGDELARVVAARLPALRNQLEDNTAILRRVGDVVENYGYGMSERWQPLQDGLDFAKETILPIAELIADAPILDWWWSSVPIQQQKWIDMHGAAIATVESVLPALSYLDKVQTSSWWWVSPIHQDILRTTRGPIGQYASVALACRGGHEIIQGDRLDIWEVQVPSSANIYEIQEPRDWSELVRQFPKLVPNSRCPAWQGWTGVNGPWWLPDWAEVAKSFDGVHVSLGGFITSAYQSLPVNNGYTILVGWNPDETVWVGRSPSALKRV